MELFRSEAIDAKRQSWTGAIRLATPVSHTVWTALVVATLLIVFAWLYLGHYTRRAQVSGSLVPEQGLLEMTARTAGTVADTRIKEGDYVHAGDPLIVLSGERSSESLGDTNAAVSLQLKMQASRLQADIADTQRISMSQSHQFVTEKRLLEGQLSQLDAQLKIQQRQTESYTRVLEKIRPLVSKGYVSALQLQDQEAQALNAEAQVRALTRQRFEVSQQLSTLTAQVEQNPLTVDGKINEIRRQLAQGEQALAQNEAERSTVLRAPADGTISSLVVKPGQTVTAGQVLLALVPSNAKLSAELLVPSSAIGFVHAGTKVSLHYQAFPYQKFGVQHGTVKQVSYSALKPAEVTALSGQQGPVESMYRVQVDLEKQDVLAYGRAVMLRPGMALDASLLLDQRRLFEWIFEPLYGMRRRQEDM